MRVRAAVTRALAFCALLGAAGAARADTVVLRDGRKLQGRTSLEGDELVVRRKYGEVRVPRADVLRIDHEDDAEAQYERRLRELGSGTSDERYRLGVWCREQGLDSEARGAFLSVLKLDPEHGGARAALGYVKDETGRWLTEDDRMRARGLVKWNGRWMTPADRIRGEAELAERRAQARALAKRAEDEREAKRQAKLEAERDARLARIRAYEEELARERARRRAADEDEPRGFTSYHGPIGPYGWIGGPYQGCGPWGTASYWSGPRVTQNEALIYAAWRSGRYRSLAGKRPFVGGWVTVRGGLPGQRDPACSPGSGANRSRDSFGAGVTVNGSYTSRNGRGTVRFRTGF